ncbi:Hypothetical predicted protein [Octopus vulgaris]|uniref:Mos1 transposase HTH domain-containing protein n=1 Tax=Octopus vulgaris TaxID=6645 RepID=A0AA36BTZ9_OCTVU|nr:Hypothetical predicted protein [Octopus vulgaris]
MEVSKERLRHTMLYECKKRNSAAEATRNMHSVYGKECLNERTCRRWFAKFRSGDFSLEDEDRIGCPIEFDDKLLEALLEENPALSVEELAIKLNSNLERFLNLENGCLVNCLKATANPELTSALLSILANSFHSFWKVL